MKGFLLKKIIVVFSLVLLSIDALAMVCEPPSTKELYEKADMVFEAVVEKRIRVKEHDQKTDNKYCWEYSEDQPDCGPKTAHLKIKEVWKGKLDKLHTIFSEDACYCLGSYLLKGENYIFFSKLAEPDKPYALISASSCGGIVLEKNFIEDKKILKNLGAAEK